MPEGERGEARRNEVRFERDRAIEARWAKEEEEEEEEWIRRLGFGREGGRDLTARGRVTGWREESHSIADRCICQSVADVSASFYVVTRLVVIIAHFYLPPPVTLTPPPEILITLSFRIIEVT